jgi:nitrite reductase (NADH) small subunit
MMPQVGRSITIKDQKIVIFQTSDLQLFALADFCPLTNAPILEGVVSSHYVYEPMRDYKISLEDGSIQEPDEGQVKTYPLEVVGDDIYLDV